MSDVVQRVLRPPESSVDHERHRMRTPTRRQAKLTELEGIVSISDSLVRRRSRQVEDLLGRAAARTAENPVGAAAPQPAKYRWRVCQRRGSKHL